MTRKKKLLLLFVLVFSLPLSLFVFRKEAFVFALEKMAPSFAYETRRWEDGELIYTQVAWGEELKIDEARLSFAWKSPFYVEAQLSLVAPLVTLNQGEETPFVPMYLPSPSNFFGCQVKMEEGALKLVDKNGSAQFFSLAYEKGHVQIGDGAPLFDVDVKEIEGDFLLSFHLEEVESSRLTPFIFFDVGEINGRCTGDFSVRLGSDLKVKEGSSFAQLVDFSWKDASKDITLIAPTLQAYVYFLGGEHRIDLTTKQATVRYASYVGEEIEAEVCLRQGVFEKTTLRGLVQGVQAEINLHGPVDTFEAEYTLSGKLMEKLPFFSYTQGKLVRTPDGYSGTGFLEEGITYGFFLSPYGGLEQGWVKADKVRDPFFKGDCKIDAVFTPHLLEGQVEYTLEEKVGVKHLLAQVTYDVDTQLLCVDNVKGVVEGKQEGYHLFLNHFQLKQDLSTQFDLELKGDETFPLKMRVEGEKQKNGTYLFSGSGLFFQTVVKNFSVELGKEREIKTASVVFNTPTLSKELTFLQEFDCLNLDPQLVEKCSLIKGGIEGTLSFSSPADLRFDLHGKDLRYQEKKVHQFEMCGIKNKAEWKVEKIVLDDFSGKGIFEPGKGGAWEGKWQELTFQGYLSYEEGALLLKALEAKHAAVPSYAMKSEGVARFTWAPTLQVSDLNLHLYEAQTPVAHFFVPALVYLESKAKWEAAQVASTFFHPQLEDYLKAELTLRFSKDTLSFQGPIEKGRMLWKTHALDLEQILGFYDSTGLHFKAKTSFCSHPFQLTCTLQPKHSFAGKIVVQGAALDEKLSLTFADSFQCVEAQGTLLGFRLALHQDRQTKQFLGEVHIQEGKKAALFFPAEKQFLQDIDRISLKGAWQVQENFSSFKGDMSGKECRLKNYLVEEVAAKVEWTPQTVKISDFSLTDPAGTIFIKQMEGIKKKQWHFRIPLLKGQNIQPSLIRKGGEKTKQIKPFMIRQLTFEQISFEGTDVHTILGQGRFYFTNAERKEDSLFDLPLEIIKKLGLDFNALTPVTGEVSCLLGEGKIYLTACSNTYSEGRRSLFYLDPESPPSYIDFDGNLAISIRLKQDALLKIAEPFALLIRGTLDKPRYQLK